MKVSREQRKLLALCAVRLDGKSIDWSLLAREAMRPGGLERLYGGELVQPPRQAGEDRALLRRALKDLSEAEARVETELAAVDELGDVHLVTVLEEDYPENLRLIWNLPPFLFVRGHVTSEDLRSVAVVGTREPSMAGLDRARRMAHALVGEGVTVVSGLARGIDTAAHQATIQAGGRAIAVIGTGITRTYPPENADLAEQVASSGAVVSQFWPTASAARWTFPRRNVVMSGIAQGTVVIEASSTSGAKMQARLAIEHGKRAFLVQSLVTSQRWASDYVAKRGAIEVADVADVMAHLASPDRIHELSYQSQLTLDLV